MREGGKRERGVRERYGSIVRETNNPDANSLLLSLCGLRADQERWMNGLMDEMERRGRRRKGVEQENK